MKPDQKTSSLFDEKVASEYESWYEQGFGLWAVRQEELLLHWQLRAFPEAKTLLQESHRYLGTISIATPPGFIARKPCWHGDL